MLDLYGWKSGAVLAIFGERGEWTKVFWQNKEFDVVCNGQDDVAHARSAHCSMELA